MLRYRSLRDQRLYIFLGCHLRRYSVEYHFKEHLPDWHLAIASTMGGVIDIDVITNSWIKTKTTTTIVCWSACPIIFEMLYTIWQIPRPRTLIRPIFYFINFTGETQYMICLVIPMWWCINGVCTECYERMGKMTDDEVYIFQWRLSWWRSLHGNIHRN